MLRNQRLLCSFNERHHGGGECPLSDQNRGERLQIMLTEDELALLDDWRFASRMPSRAAAVRELLKRGLAAEGYARPDGRVRSSDFGISRTDGEDQPA